MSRHPLAVLAVHDRPARFGPIADHRDPVPTSSSSWTYPLYCQPGTIRDRLRGRSTKYAGSCRSPAYQGRGGQNSAGPIAGGLLLAVSIHKISDMSPPPGQVPDLVARVAAGDREAIVELLARYRSRLRRMVALRLDPRLQGRVDASDVIQEGYLDAIKRLEEYIRDPSVSFYIWLRFLVGQRVTEYHRRYLSRPGRDVGREVSIYRGAMPGLGSGALAARLLGKLTSPSQAAVRAECKLQLQEALNRMDPIDREVLVLRHYEQMSNGDAAAVFGLEKAAASKRYTRALERLGEILANLPGGVDGDVS